MRSRFAVRPIKAFLMGAATIAAFVACSDSESKLTSPDAPSSVRSARTTSTGPTVKSTLPSSAPQNVTLDVQITGSGFEAGSTAKWLLNGVEDLRVKTNSTTFVSSTSLVANITISQDAAPSLYDVAVITPLGKKGIGTEKFTVLAMEQLSATGDAIARDVNAAGIIVGTMSGGCDGYAKPAVWINKVVQPLPLPSDLCLGRAMHINDAGIIVGYANRTGAVSHTTDAVVIWTPITGGYSAILPGLAPDGTNPWDVGGMNENGHVVVNHCCAAARAYWWSQATGYVRLIDAPGTAGCHADDVNDNDEIIGWCRTTPASSDSLNESAAYWSSPSAVPELLPRLTGYNYVNTAQSLNNSGLAVGQASNRSKGGRLTTTGVTWTRITGGWVIATMPDLGGGETTPVDMNDNGWVTGSSRVTSGNNHAFLWRRGEAMRDLGAVGPESNAFGLNSAASPELLIVGTSVSGNVYRAILWKPQL
jgi:probable HAF family extracellular repeat protein